MRELVFAALVGWGAVTGGCSTGSPTVSPPPACMEDQPCWDCKTMGNKQCGEIEMQSFADANWEGLTGEQQQMLQATGETGAALDELVIAYRQAVLDNPNLDLWVEKDTDGLWAIYGK